MEQPMKNLCLIVIMSIMLVGLIAIEVESDAQATFEKCRLEAESGSTEAVYNLGVMYMMGQGVKMDLSQGYTMISEAAEKGFPAAQNWMGDFYADYYSGDMAQAIGWWNKAAVQGDPNAQYSIGKCLDEGLGVVQNLPNAVYWYQQSASQNHSDAKLALSKCYQEGRGTKKNLKEAYFWLLLCFPGSWEIGEVSLRKLESMIKPKDVKKIRARALKWMDAHRAEA